MAKLDAPDEPDPAILPSGPAAQLTAIFARLPDASSKKAIDDIALEFALLNSKVARKRLVKVRIGRSFCLWAMSPPRSSLMIGKVSS